jgi:hypothetical protein
MRALRGTRRLAFAAVALVALTFPAATTGARRPVPLVSFVGYASDLADSPTALYTVRADGRGRRKLFGVPR